MRILNGYCETCPSLKQKEHDESVSIQLSYEGIEQQLKSCPMSYVPALLAVLIERIRREPIFKGWMGLQSFISRAYKKAGEQ